LPWCAAPAATNPASAQALNNLLTTQLCCVILRSGVALTGGRVLLHAVGLKASIALCSIV